MNSENSSSKNAHPTTLTTLYQSSTRLSSNPELDHKEYAFTYGFVGIERLIVTPVRVTNPKENLHLDTYAIWDTGAMHSCVCGNVIAALALKPLGQKKISSATGIQKTHKFRTNVFIEHLPYFELEVLECGPLLNESIGMLIGMDVISRGDFAITNHDGHTVFTFCVPSVGALNFCDE